MYAMLAATVAWYWAQTVRAFRVTMGLFVDSFEWSRGQMFRRRISVATNSHRQGRENSVPVWQILRANEESEFGLTPVRSHRDRRGWRYAPMIWGMLERITDEERIDRRMAEAVEGLMKQIHWMLSNPPLAVTEHGAVRSEYRPETLWMEMIAA